MCIGIAIATSEIPEELAHRHGLARRRHLRGDQPEYRFLFKDRRPRLPVWRHGQLFIARWGNGRGQSRSLPRTGWTWLKTIKEGGWQHVETEPVDIPATFCLEVRGVWYHVETGIRGLLVKDEHGSAVVYMLIEPTSHYYKNMNGSVRMPVFVNQGF